MKVINYHSLTLKLNNRSNRPHKKPNEETNYVHVNPNQSPFILKQLPISIEKRISSLSSSKEIFEETAPYYEKYISNLLIQRKAKLLGSNTSRSNYRKDTTKKHYMAQLNL